MKSQVPSAKSQIPRKFLFELWILGLKLGALVLGLCSLVLGLGAFGFELSLAQPLLKPSITIFSPKQYEAHHQIFCSAMGRDGTIYLGTAFYILQYNGTDWKKHFVKPGFNVMSIDVDEQGVIWLGGNGDFGYMEPEGVSPPSRGEPEGGRGRELFHSLLHLAPDSTRNFNIIWNTYAIKGNIFFNSWKYFFRFSEDTMEVIKPEKSFFSSHKLLLPSPSGATELWMQDRGRGIIRFSIEKGKNLKKTYVPGTDFFNDKSSIMSILPWDSSNVLVCTGKDGLFLLTLPQSDEVNLHPPSGGRGASPFAPSLKPLFEKAILNRADALEKQHNPFNAWVVVGTQRNGMMALTSDGKMTMHLNQSTGFPDNTIWTLLPFEGGVWCGTNNGCATILLSTPLTFAKEGEDFSGGVLDISFYTAERKELFIATWQGVYHLVESEGAGMEFKMVPGTEGQCGALESFSNALLVGSGSNGLLEIYSDGKEYRSRQIAKEDPYTLASFSYQLQNEEEFREIVASGGRDGIVILQQDGEKWHKLFHLKEVPEEVGSLAFSSGDDSLIIWAGFRTRGMMRLALSRKFFSYSSPYKDSLLVQKSASLCSTHNYDTSAGLPPGSIGIFSFQNRLVFGADSGLFRLSPSFPLPYNGKLFIPDTSLGSLFIPPSAGGKGQGVFLLMEGEDDEVWVESGSGQIFHFTNNCQTIDTIPFKAIDIGIIRAIFPEKGTGIIWFGGDNGVVRYDGKVVKNFLREYLCLISSVTIPAAGAGGSDSILFDGVFHTGEKEKRGDSEYPRWQVVSTQPQWMAPVIDYTLNSIRFTYSSPFYEFQEKVEYTYLLDGFDKEWSKWTKETKKEYTNLPEGEYTFRVKARNVYGKESKAGEYRFTVLPPWYRTWLAYFLYLTAAIAIIGFGIWQYLRKRHEQKLRKIAEAKRDMYYRQVEEQKKVVEERNKVVEEQKKIVEEAHKNTMDSIEYAKRIQVALLTSDEYVRQNLAAVNAEHFILFRPKDIVSGDFYWALKNGGSFYLAVADCTGHGVSGAFLSLLGMSFLNELVIERKIESPEKILNALRSEIVQRLNPDGREDIKDGMEMLLCRFNLNDRSAEYSSANIRSVLVRGKELFEQERDESPIGVDFKVMTPFTLHRPDIMPGDMLYAFSDGYADQTGGPKNKKFMRRNLNALLVSVAEEPVSRQKELIAQAFDDWKGSGEQIDDVTVIGIRI